MRVSLNHINRLIDFELPPIDALVTKINRQLGKVETVIDLNRRYDGAVIVHVDSCEKHPNADKLNVCMVDEGSGELTQVVCGAPNVRAGMFAVWLKPGSTVPSTADDEPFVLGARELRGVMSNGMLASPKELAIGDSQDGILEVTEYDLVDGTKLIPGAAFSELFGLDDTIVDIENKMFTHRPDLFGQVGVAREIAGISGHAFTSPEWYATEPEFEQTDGLELSTFNEAFESVPRLMFLPMKNVTIKPSPLWLQCALVALGSKPINNVVDATNYVMLLTAQPTHAYDYDTIRGGRIGARMATAGEQATLLNGKTYTLSEADIVIADAEGPIGLGGIMGGAGSEVSESTKNIIIEVATFDMYAVRKSSMRQGIFTDALTRFNKGQSPLQNHYVLAYLQRMLTEVAGAEPAGHVVDLHEESLRTDERYVNLPFTITPAFINARLGLELDGTQIAELLSNVELNTTYDQASGELVVARPFWRTDIDLPEDIVEEVGRLYGFDKLPRELPRRSMRPAPVNAKIQLKQRIRTSLSIAGANEVLTYSFVHGKQLEKAGYDPADSFKLSNAVSPELQYYRPFVLPSLLDKVRTNIKNGYDEFALFELGRGHSKSLDPNEDGLPGELETIDMVYAAKKPQSGAAFYRMRRLIDALADDLGIRIMYRPAEASESGRTFEPSRSAELRDADSGKLLGVVGEFSGTITKNFKLPEYSAGVSMYLDALHEISAERGVTYRPLSKYPSVMQDISLRMKTDVPYAEVMRCIESVLQNYPGLTIDTKTLAIYAPEDKSTKTVTVRLVATSQERTLSDDDVSAIVGVIGERVAEDISAQIV